MQVAIIGAGWAGLAAAIAAAQAGHTVSVFEAARMLGGRARALAPAEGADTQAPSRLDNGQHILIGAYTECLRLMRLVGIDPDAALLRTPLALVFPDGSGLRFPDAAPPWDALRGIAGARSWLLAERMALLRRAVRWRLSGFRCAPEVTVEQLCQGLPARLLREFIDPLCVSALNTPIEAASGAVFLRVLRDSLFSGRGGSHLLLPRRDLSALWPEAAASWLQAHGHAVHTGRRIHSMEIAPGSGRQAWRVDGMPFDAVVVATTSTEATRLVAAAAAAAPPAAAAAMRAWAATAAALRFTAIATVYAKAAGPLPHALSRHEPMLALRSGREAPAQFVFDRGRLGGEPGQLAFVVSAFEGERAVLEQAVLRQAREQLGLEGLQAQQTVVEKRATFACVPALDRPAQEVIAGLLACGDYVAGPYPATLEGAVLSGTAAGRSL
ncbi:hydroxysqualene dehydroxylase HpnE [Paracidovorax cattleyae]|uniref:Squalene-associated FAD-dependent desaturase n=1 Tax=Paracidovorax cattleyae TaxID=80868 RepID=A0A1H0W3I8_9BURK|nr:hydroxysqualene dehydroxylase HpnE [Paracidovorax cattleyae]AVS73759.1 FAD-dependent oxidoreductase [Paracidovorax cattleyae]SDP85279.1 squalene-associated FAD-dependent desaturase [Paracidovorax cattleyae]